jgi:hypothetical protein
MPLMWLKCLILILKMAWAKLISFLNGLISKISQNKPVKPVKFFSSFPDVDQLFDHPLRRIGTQGDPGGDESRCETAQHGVGTQDNLDTRRAYCRPPARLILAGSVQIVQIFQSSTHSDH